MNIDAAATGPTEAIGAGSYSRPPALHWSLLLLFTLLTGGIFTWVWIFRQAGWVKRIDPSSRAHLVLVIAFISATAVSALLLVFASSDMTRMSMKLVYFGFAVTSVWACFSMRQSIEDRFDVSLSGILTFFLNVYYVQYHITRIAKGLHTPGRYRLLA